MRETKKNGAEDINPRWLDLKFASAYCSMSENTLMRYIRDGRIYAIQIDGKGKWRVDRHSIDAFLLAKSVDDEEILARLRG